MVGSELLHRGGLLVRERPPITGNTEWLIPLIGEGREPRGPRGPQPCPLRVGLGVPWVRSFPGVIKRSRSPRGPRHRNRQAGFDGQRAGRCGDRGSRGEGWVAFNLLGAWPVVSKYWSAAKCKLFHARRQGRLLSCSNQGLFHSRRLTINALAAGEVASGGFRQKRNMIRRVWVSRSDLPFSAGFLHPRQYVGFADKRPKVAVDAVGVPHDLLVVGHALLPRCL